MECQLNSKMMDENLRATYTMREDGDAIRADIASIREDINKINNRDAHARRVKPVSLSRVRSTIASEGDKFVIDDELYVLRYHTDTNDYRLDQLLDLV